MSEEEREKLEEIRKPLRESLEKYAKETAEKLCQLRVNIYSNLLDKMIREVIDKKKPNKISVHLTDNNILHFLPSADKVTLIYGIDFKQVTDQSLVRVFLQELKDAKNHVNNCVSCNTYTAVDNIPKQVSDTDDIKKYSNGFVVFDLFVKNYEKLKKKLYNFIILREYIQYHVHSIKAFLHIRMNRKGRSFMEKLDGCKIIPDLYMKYLNELKFYENWSKKEENLKLFSEEYNKVNV